MPRKKTNRRRRESAILDLLLSFLLISGGLSIVTEEFTSLAERLNQLVGALRRLLWG